MTFLELEKKCKKRKFLKILKAVLFLLLIISAGVYYIFINNNTVKKEKKQNLTVKQINGTEHKRQDTNTSTVKKTKKEQSFAIKQENGIKEGNQEKNHTKAVNNERLNFIIDLNISEPHEQIKKPKEKPKKFTKTASVKIKKESSFIMSTKKLPSYNTCIALTEKYYNQGNYKEALKWAKNANIQNNKKPESWILSAKSLYKMGKKEEALKILKIYYNYHQDEQIKKLMGKLNESN